MLLKTQAATEVVRFLAHHPDPEQIVAFHPSFEVAERAYRLIYSERGFAHRRGTSGARELSDD